jgi:hypothetical protein
LHLHSLRTAEYGDPDDKDDFESLRKVSPLHSTPYPSFPTQLTESGVLTHEYIDCVAADISSEPNYPAVLLTTAEVSLAFLALT